MDECLWNRLIMIKFEKSLKKFLKSSVYNSCLKVPAKIYLLKVNNRNTRARCEVCSKLTIKTLERH